MTRLLLSLTLAAVASAQPVRGLRDEYLNDFDGTARELVQLAGAIPAASFAWRPAPGVRSVSEVYVHIAAGNYLLLAITGVKPPADRYPAGTTDPKAIYRRNLELEKSITAKDQVTGMLKASLEAVRAGWAKATPADLDREVNFFGQKTTVRRAYIRMLAHANEHLGQGIAYARVNGVVPPWSK